jgi:methylated-DNA-[protein]-cysteine S-methyltransferase
MGNIYATSGKARNIHFFLLWKNEPEFMVERLHIGSGIEFKGCREGECSEASRISLLIEDYLLGGAFELPIDALNSSQLSPFHSKALFTLREKVPAGRVTSYGRLAEMAGSPGGGRAVGQAMSRNPFPLFFPCHRILNSDRRLGNYGPGPDLKRKLLENEGVIVEKNDIISENFFV